MEISFNVTKCSSRCCPSGCAVTGVRCSDTKVKYSVARKEGEGVEFCFLADRTCSYLAIAVL